MLRDRIVLGLQCNFENNYEMDASPKGEKENDPKDHEKVIFEDNDKME